MFSTFCVERCRKLLFCHVKENFAVLPAWFARLAKPNRLMRGVATSARSLKHSRHHSNRCAGARSWTIYYIKHNILPYLALCTLRQHWLAFVSPAITHFSFWCERGKICMFCLVLPFAKCHYVPLFGVFEVLELFMEASAFNCFPQFFSVHTHWIALQPWHGWSHWRAVVQLIFLSTMPQMPDMVRARLAKAGLGQDTIDPIVSVSLCVTWASDCSQHLALSSRYHRGSQGKQAVTSCQTPGIFDG